ncbi:MAG TPA: class II glutamine amidotransferase [Gammaproteobacteria bacterium]|nr:class II glutamine amidotransferase [Gammaproteobacteria bacterium]
MCRLAAYLGPDISLQAFLTEPPHSLVEQAAAPRELRFARLNADGYGFGWFAPDGRPAVYTSPLPIWSDVNLPHLSRALSAPLWLAAVRSATPGNPVNHANTQPFWDDELIYLHNGYVEEFARELRPQVQEQLSPEVGAAVLGNTDSEYLFALMRQLLAEDADLSLEGALAELAGRIEEALGDGKALLNVVVSEGGRLYALRHAVNSECPSLYYTTDDEAFPSAQLLASERLTEAGFWQPVPEHHILILDPEEPPELLAL